MAEPIRRRNTVRRVPRSLAVAMLMMPGPVACGDAPGPGSDSLVRHDTVGGVLHVVSGERGTWAAGASWSVADSGVVIGQADGADEYVLGEVAGLAVDDGGRIWAPT